MTATDVEIGVDPATGTGGTGRPVESANMRFVPFVEGAPSEAERAALLAKKSLLIPVMVFILALVAAAGVTVTFAKKPKEAPSFQDLGAGISNASGLKGSLQVRWQGSRAQYQLKFEPTGPLQAAGFAFVSANPPLPILVNVRILDATGFALCTKSVAFPFGTASASGTDIFQNFVGTDGSVSAVNAQGLLPCTEDQFRQASYWDFTSNFPTTTEQQALINGASAAKIRQQAEARAAQLRRSRSQSTAIVMGDDRASGYDSSRGVLEARLGRDFQVVRNGDRTAASSWAAESALFHYKCDQRSRCLLTHAGGTETIAVFAMQ